LNEVAAEEKTGNRFACLPPANFMRQIFTPEWKAVRLPARHPEKNAA
jgi:hypothetical protein